MTKSFKNPHALKVFSKPNMLENLSEALKLGETIIKSLNQNLEEKRMFFTRFFFLTNDELIEIINASSNLLRVEPHLIKCFEGIRKLKYTPNNYIVGMVSSEHEVVNFCKEINPFRDKGAIHRF